MNRQHLIRGTSTLLIALMGLPLAWSQPEGVMSQASAEAFAASAEIAFQAASDDFLLAQGNMGGIENPALWSQIVQSHELMTAAHASEEWLAVIERSQRVSADVRILLTEIEFRAQVALDQMRAAMQEFETLGAEEHVPSLVEESRACVSRVERLIDHGQYTLGITLAHECLVRIEQTVVESKRSLANQGISEIEDLIAEIVNAGGDRRMTERYRTLTEHFDEMLIHYYDSEFDEALSEIHVLRPMAEQMLSDLQPSQP